MRRSPWLLFLLTLCCAVPAQDRGHASRRRNRDRPATELKNVTFHEEHFRSEAVGKEAPYGVYLPKSYEDEADRRWPLVIWLHGMWEDHMRFHRRFGATVLDAAVADGTLPECVFVLANGGRTSMYINAGKGKNYQDLVQKDLLEHIEKTYRVLPGRENRALMGISMGGMAALRIAFSDPDRFGTAAVHSSAVFPLDPAELPPRLLALSSRFGLDEVFGDPIDAGLWAKTNPLGLAAGLKPSDLHGLRLYLDAGTEDRFGFGRSNLALHELLRKRKIPHEWTLVKGGGHAWNSGFRESSLRASLKFVGDGFRAAAKRRAKGHTPAKAGKDG